MRQSGIDRAARQGSAKVYGTYATEQKAREKAETLGDLGRAALVVSVREMALSKDPLTPRTVNPWAVLVRA